MEYTEVSFTGAAEFQQEMLTALLAELGFESFSDSGDKFLAYIPTSEFQEAPIVEIIESQFSGSGISFTQRIIPAENWNRVWESAYDPVVIAGQCMVRAPFHEPLATIAYDLVIEPKMSFGTAHHETTSLMIGLLLDENVKGRSVLDMGCGTAVLAILAAKMGAERIVAIDNDEWAFTNSLENISRNGVRHISVMHGDNNTIPLETFDLILANINRNVLLEGIPAYAGHLQPGGILLMSGFYADDLPAIRNAASGAGLEYSGQRMENCWIAAKFIRK